MVFCESTLTWFIAHLGGLLMGLLVGTTFYPVISVTKRHKLIMWFFRLAAIPLTIILFIVLMRNFYTSDPYAGEHYASHVPLIKMIQSNPIFQHVLDVATFLASPRPPIITAKGMPFSLYIF
jgi:hypothetical protein